MSKEKTYPCLEVRPVAKLKAHPDGIRATDIDSKFNLGSSIEFFAEFGGLLRPLVLNVTTETILDGDQVLNQLRSRNVENVPCWCVKIPVEFEDAAHLALNNHAGAWEWEHVAARLKDLKTTGRKAELTGFPSCKIAALCAVEEWNPKEPNHLDGVAIEQDGFKF